MLPELRFLSCAAGSSSPYIERDSGDYVTRERKQSNNLVEFYVRPRKGAGI